MDRVATTTSVILLFPNGCCFVPTGWIFFIAYFYFVYILAPSDPSSFSHLFT